MSTSVVALPPSIDVPRTIPIGLTDAALHRPTRSAAVPCAPSTTAVVAVTWVLPVVIVAVVVGLRGATAIGTVAAVQAQGIYFGYGWQWLAGTCYL